MNRLFGSSKPAAPKPTLGDATASMEKRGESIDQKIMKLDKELGCPAPPPAQRNHSCKAFLLAMPAFAQTFSSLHLDPNRYYSVPRAALLLTLSSHSCRVCAAATLSSSKR